jgi:DNA-binding transcriptional MerR regulator
MTKAGYMTEGEVAEMFNVSIHTVRQWRQRGQGPPYRKIVSQVRYLKDDVEKWADGNMVIAEAKVKQK